MSENKRKSNGFLVQGTILAAAGIITKIIGAIYRIPMLNIMGLQGQGYYDIAFQVYTIALMISSYSLPLAVSKLVSARVAVGEKKNAYRILKAALIFATSVGSIIMLGVYFGADFIATHLMGASVSSYALRVLAPGLLIVAIMGVLRGYFQGLGTMIPTAISQILEQIVNAVVSIVGAAMLMGYGQEMAKRDGNTLLGPAYSAAGGTLGTVAGALIGLIFLVVCYYAYNGNMKKQIKRDPGNNLYGYKIIYKMLLLTIAPVVLSSAIYNIGNVLGSAMFNNIMSAQGHLEAECVEQLGKIGQYYTLVNVPLAVANALGASMIPGLVGAYACKDKNLLFNRIYMAVRYTMLIAIPSAFGFFAIGKPILDFIWPSVENSVQGMMLKVGAISLIFYSLSTITNAVLQGMNHMMKPVKNATITLVIQTAALFVMLAVFKWGIFSVLFSKIIFSFCMCVLNARDIRNAVGYVQEREKTFYLPALAGLCMGIAAFFTHSVLDLFMNGRMPTLIAILVAIVVYSVCLLKFHALTEDEILGLPKGATILTICKKLHLIKNNMY